MTQFQVLTKKEFMSRILTRGMQLQEAFAIYWHLSESPIPREDTRKLHL